MHDRLKTLALLGAAALLVHLAVLGGLQWTWAQRPAPPATLAQAPPLHVVSVELAPPGSATASVPDKPAKAAVPAPVATAKHAMPAVAPLVASPAALRDPAPPVRVGAAAVVKTAAAPSGVKPPAPVSSAPLLVDAGLALNAAPVASVASVTAVTAAPSAPHDVAPIAPLAQSEPTIPHYRTQAPPATLLRYALQRGVLRGTGELRWRPDGAHYELQLDGRVGPLAVLTQVSSGGFDAAGLAPLRFTDKRLRRPTAAVNFQREAGKITFSGPSTEFPLRAGMQDRLSWMVQLAAVVAAEPALRKPGAMVLMGVVGVSADAGVWAFRCVGREAVDTDAGSVADALKYVRDPHDLHDTTVQVWLDPQRHYLPIHATQKSGPGDEEFSLRLLESTSLP